MYLKNLLETRKTIGFRLTLWYSCIFILSSLLLFIVGYFFVSSTLKKHDREMVLTELGELHAEYAAGGMRALEKGLNITKKLRKKTPFFVRIAGTENNTLNIFLPYQWVEFDLKKFEEIIPNSKNRWIRLPAMDDEYILEVASASLPDGRWLQVGMSTEKRERLLAHFRESFVVIMIPLVLLGFVGGYLLSFRALKPIRQIIQTVRSLDIGKMEAHIPSPRTGDELDELIRLFNEMLERIKTLISSMKGSLDNVAHDFRTPMMRFRGVAERALQRGQDEGCCREALADCLEESDQILRMLNTLMDISEAETGVMNLTRKVVDISPLMQEVIDVYEYVAEEKDLSIHANIPPELYAPADANRITQALANLLDNAIKYTPSKGKILLEAHGGPGEVTINIKDTGVGIPREDLPKIWDRLYRGNHKYSQKGLGLGLSQVKAIVQAHRGRVDVVSELEKGSTFTIHLPTSF